MEDKSQTSDFVSTGQPECVNIAPDHLAKRPLVSPDNKGQDGSFSKTYSNGHDERLASRVDEHNDMDTISEISTNEQETSSIADYDMNSTSLADDRKRSQRISLRSRINRRPIQDRPRQKRQTLQDMARPLKQWLYKNKDNPYPTKTDKVSLALGSQMTLTQVSNWFANARRRLKNTVRRPGISWSSRIKMYNSHVEGNAELLSISSEDSSLGWSDEDNTVTDNDADMDEDIDDFAERLPNAGQNQTKQKHSDVWSQNNPKTDDTYSSPYYRPIRDNKTSYVTPNDQSEHSFVSTGPGKFKNSIMQRYLNDAYHHTFSMQQRPIERRRNPSRGSMGSHDYEELSSSSRSSPTYDHTGNSLHDDSTDELESFIKQRKISGGQSAANDLYWKEISAAMALTNLARSNHSSSPCY